MSIVSLKTIYAKGVNAFGQLGIPNKYENLTTFTPIPKLTNMPITSFYASWAQSAALLDDGTFLLWGWPLDVRSQMQASWTRQDNYKLFKFIQRYSFIRWISYKEGKDFPDPVLVPDNVNSVSIGGGYILLSTTFGRAFGWGENHRGQIGQNGCHYQHFPVLVEKVSSIVQVAAGYQHSLFLDKNGHVFSTGRSTYSAIGVAPVALVRPLEYIDQPIEIQISGIKKIAAGNNFSIFLAQNGELLGLGKNEYGQCGQPNVFEVIKDPTPIFMPEKMVDVVCGSKHSLALGESGKVYGWGSKQNGELDGIKHGSYREQCSAAEIELPVAGEVRVIKAGFDRSCCILKTGEVFVWGGQDNSMIDGENYEGVHLLNPDLPHIDIDDVALGFMHTLVLGRA